MRKNIYTFLAVAFAAGLLAGCGSKDSGKDTTIVVGASPAPHAEILEAAKPVLEKAGYTLEIKEYNDYVQPEIWTPTISSISRIWMNSMRRKRQSWLLRP